MIFNPFIILAVHTKNQTYEPKNQTYEPDNFCYQARLTLGVRAKKTWGHFEYFWIANLPQVTNKCWNIHVKILTRGVTFWPCPLH